MCSSGKFTSSQAEIYSAVLFVQNGIIESLKSRPSSLDELYIFMIVSFSQKLFELGFFKGLKRDEILRQVRELCPQFVGHHIGLDLHDIIDTPTSATLRPGMVITVLPGLYIPEDPRNGFRKKINFMTILEGCRLFIEKIFLFEIK